MDIEDMGLPYGALADLNGDKYEILLQLIAFISEKSYRRGFQQGYWAANETGDHRPMMDLAEWRYDHTLHEAISPYTGLCEHFSLERLQIECAGELAHIFGGLHS